MKKVIGGLMVGAFMLGMFTMTALRVGWLDALLIWAIAIGATAFLAIGMGLLTGGIE